MLPLSGYVWRVQRNSEERELREIGRFWIKYVDCVRLEPDLVGILEEDGNDDEMTDETHNVDDYDEDKNEEYDDY